jgi:hypothetical protein
VFPRPFVVPTRYLPTINPIYSGFFPYTIGIRLKNVRYFPMALSPADFYAYSRATGVQVPEDPQERAEMAPEVLEFRRNQLKSPQQEPNILQAVGATALAGAAALGAGLAARRFMRGRGQIPQGPARSATQGVVQQDLSTLRRAAAAEPVARPVAEPIAEPVAPSRPAPGTTENALPVDRTDRLLEELGQMQASRKQALESRMSRALWTTFAENCR